MATLTAAKAKATSRLRDLTVTRQELAFAGFVGSPADRKRQAEAAEEFLRAEIDAADIGYAIKEAERRVEEARANAGVEAIRQRAEDAQQHTAQWRHHGHRAAAAFAEFLVEFDAMIASASAIRRLKICRFPDHEVLDTSLKLAVQGHLFKRRLHPEPLLSAPHTRRELTDVVDLWGDQTDIALGRVISGEAQPPAEPAMEMPERDYIAGEKFLDPDPVDQAAE